MDDAKKNALQTRDKAGQYGTDLHKILEKALLGEKIQSGCDDDIEFFLAITEWLEDKSFNIEECLIEEPIVNIEHGYAGSVDFYDGLGGVLYDLKTSKSVYDSHILQLAGYWVALSSFLTKQYSEFVFPIKAKILHWDKQEKVLTEIDITNKVKKQIRAFLLLVDFYYASKNRRVWNLRTKKIA